MLRVEALRSDALDSARRVVASPDGSAQQLAHVASMRAVLATLETAERAEREIIESAPDGEAGGGGASVAFVGLMVSALDAVPVTYRDESDLREAISRAPELAEQLAGLSALHRAQSARGVL